MRRRYYIAGPMTGHPQFNFPLFHRAAKELRALGYDVVSPSELDDPKTMEAAMSSPDGAPGSGSTSGETWADFLARDVKLIADDVDGIIFLPDWQKSRGARLEAFVALLTGKSNFANYREGDDPQPIPAAMVRQIIQGNMP